MEKKYILNERYDKEFESKTEISWKYFSKKEISRIEKEENRKIRIVGELVNKEEKSIGKVWNEEDSLLFGNYKEHNSLLYRIAGFIECEDGTYIAVVKRNFFLIPFIFLLASIILLALLNLIGGPKFDDSAIAFEPKIERPADWDESKIAIPGYNDLVGKVGDSELAVSLWNPKGNPVYFKFEVILDDTKEVLIKTDLVKPGDAIKKIPIDPKMKAGKYPITITINTYSLEDYKVPMNSSDVKTNLILKE